QKSGNVSEEPWCSTTGGRGRPPALISPSRFSHRSPSENRAGQLLSQKRAREATKIGGLPLVLALVFRLRRLAVGVDLLDAGDAALHFVIEENRDQPPKSHHHPECSRGGRRPPGAQSHNEKSADEVACRLEAIQSFLLSDPDHSPVQLGLRFCEKGKGPSMASFECHSFSLRG